jgi:hypothetical protein
MTDTAPTTPERPSGKRILIGSAVALAVAAAGLVVFVLPAEYGIDPTGVGSALGLTKLSDPGEENIYLKRGLARTNVLFPLGATAKPDEATLLATLADKGVPVPANLQVQSDHWEFELLPYEGIEMKYRLAQGQPMIFAWRTSGMVNYDMHSVPDPGDPEATESFSIEDANAQTAVYVAPFTGIHGWYWQNRTLGNVTLTIDSTGGYTGAVIFDPAGEHPRELTPPTE